MTRQAGVELLIDGAKSEQRRRMRIDVRRSRARSPKIAQSLPMRQVLLFLVLML